MLEKQNHLMQTSTARCNNADSLLLSFMRLLPDRKIHGTAADRTALLPSPHPTDRTTATKCPTVPHIHLLWKDLFACALYISRRHYYMFWYRSLQDRHPPKHTGQGVCSSSLT